MFAKTGKRRNLSRYIVWLTIIAVFIFVLLPTFYLISYVFVRWQEVLTSAGYGMQTDKSLFYKTMFPILKPFNDTYISTKCANFIWSGHRWRILTDCISVIFRRFAPVRLEYLKRVTRSHECLFAGMEWLSPPLVRNDIQTGWPHRALQNTVW